MTSFGGYLRGKICGVVPSRRAKTVPSRAFGRFQEFTKALKIPGKQESEIILPWEKKIVVQKKYLYLDRAIGDNNGMTHYKTFRQWIGLCRTATACYIPKTFKCLETRILPWLSYQDFRENCNSRQCFLQCVFHQVILIKQTRFLVKLQCDFSHKAFKLKEGSLSRLWWKLNKPTCSWRKCLAKNEHEKTSNNYPLWSHF